MFNTPLQLKLLFSEKANLTLVWVQLFNQPSGLIVEEFYMARTIEELSQTEISELINKRISIFTPEDVASKLKGELEKTGRYEALVVGGGKIGMVTIRDLLGVEPLEQTKLVKLWKSQWQTPVTSDSWVQGVATELVRINARALPVVENMKPVGIISQVDIVAAMADCGDLKKTPARDLAKMAPVTLEVGAKVAEARKLMLDRGISHVPITKEGKLAGIVTAADLVQYFSQGVGKRKTGELPGEKVTKFPGIVDGIMDKHPLTVSTVRLGPRRREGSQGSGEERRRSNRRERGRPRHIDTEGASHTHSGARDGGGDAHLHSRPRKRGVPGEEPR